MAKQITNEYIPNEVSHPGETLLDVLEERGMSQAELADRTGRPKKIINEIIKGKLGISPETAIQLERTRRSCLILESTAAGVRRVCCEAVGRRQAPAAFGVALELPVLRDGQVGLHHPGLGADRAAAGGAQLLRRCVPGGL